MKKQSPFVPEEYYHVYNHAIGWENIFLEYDNYLYFLRRYKFFVNDVVETLAYCLLPNHFHLVIKVKSETDLIAFIQKRSSYLTWI